ncbi:acetylxylan esterase, partial [Enterocloster asparagiformis]
MRYIEERLRELEAYRPELTRRPDFGEFWENTLSESHDRELRPTAKQVDYPCGHARVYDISYDGFDGTRIHGWFLVPAFGKAGRWPCLIQYHGFTDSRGLPWQLMHWVMAGMAVLAVDCRAQGGVTGNRAHYTDSGMVANVTTLGILDPHEYYYRAVYMDCVRAVDFAAGRPE